MIYFVLSCLIFVIVLLVWSAHSIAKQKNSLAATLSESHENQLKLILQLASESQARLVARSPAEFQAYQTIPVESPDGYISYDTSDSYEEAAPADLVFDLTPEEMIDQIDQEYNESNK